MPQLQEVLPAELVALSQWVCRGKRGNNPKTPFNPRTGYAAKAGQPDTWATFEDATAAVAAGSYTGLGFEFNANGIVGVDFDHCITEGTLNPNVAEWVNRFDSYTEISPSGSGLHILCKGHLPGKARKTSFAEMYDKGRYFTVTGKPYGTPRPLRNSQAAIDALYQEICPSDTAPIIRPSTATPRGTPAKDYLKTGLQRDKKFLSLWNGERPNGNESSDDQGLMNKLAYWCNCNPDQMAAAFNSSPHMVSKDPQHMKKAVREDYINRTIEAAVKACSATAEQDDKSYKLQRKQRTFGAAPLPQPLEGLQGQPVTQQIVAEALDAFHVTVRHNLINNTIDIEGLPAEYSETAAANTLPVFLRDKLKAAEIKCSRAEIDDYILVLSDINRYNPVADMLLNTSWDEADRFPVIYEILGIDGEKSSLYRTFVRKWFVQCVAMALNNEKHPVGADGVLVLQGSQGVGKTRFFSVLALNPDWFVEGASIDTDDKDSLLKSTGTWICELGELDSTLKKEQAALKAHITARSDSIRAPYAKTATKRPRRTSYCGTVNPRDYLRDETGSRRFWTVPVEQIDLEKLTALSRAWIMQLWAQAYGMYRDDPTGYRLTPDERAVLEYQNTQYAKLLPYEQELRDAFDFELSPHNWSKLTAAEISTRITNGKAPAEQIGKVLKKMIKDGEDITQTISKGKTRYCVPIAYPQTHSL